MKVRFLLFLLLALNLPVRAQYTFQKIWDKRYGGTSRDIFCMIKESPDSGFILSGASSSPISGNKTESCLGSDDCWLVKLDKHGNKLWDKRLGGTGNESSFTVALSDKNFVVGAPSSTNMNGDKSEPSRGGFDFWLIKIDSAGNKLWDKTYGGSLDDGGGSLIKTSDGGFLFGGVSESDSSYEKSENNRDFTHFTGDFWIVKTDSAGNKLWDKTLGGNEHESLKAMAETKDGSYILGGISGSNISGDKSENTFSNNYYDYWVIKIDSQGNKLWDKTYGTTNEDILEEIIPLSGGRSLLAGTARGGVSGNKSIIKGQYGCWLVFIDSVGNILDEWGYDGGGFNSIVTTIDGGYLIAGDAGNGPLPLTDKSESNLGIIQSWLLKIDSTGQKQWDKTIFTDTREESTYALQTSDGCYIVANGSYSGIGGYKTEANWDSTGNTTDYWVVKFCMEEWNSMDNRPQTTDNGKMQVQVYPNPFSSDLSIALLNQEMHEATFTITDAVGRVVYQKEESNLAKGYTKVLDLGPLAKGVYFVEVNAGGEKTVKRVVKE